jgi:hypothetical protein
MSGLMTSAGAIAATQDIELQREIFIPFSKSIYELLKVAKYECLFTYSFVQWQMEVKVLTG